MTKAEKLRKAATVAVAYYLEQERENATKNANLKKGPGQWKFTVNEMRMNSRQIIQRRGRIVK